MKPTRIVLLAALLGCGSSSPSAGTSSSGAGGGTGGEGGSPFSSGTSSVSTSSGATTDCSEAAQLVYLLSLENDLYTFAPETLEITEVGALDCPTDSEPYDMAVGRDGAAWVVMIDGSLFELDTATAHCKPSTYAYDDSGFGFGGLAFVRDLDGTETLYTSTRERANGQGACSCGTATDDDGTVTCFPIGKGLATVDLMPLQIAPIADYTAGLVQQNLSFTGTGDGRLFGYFNGYPVQCGASGAPSVPGIVHIDRDTGATPDFIPVEEVLVGQSSTWAFSFWGGDFWLYSSNGGNSRVTRHRYSGDGSFTVVVPDTGMRIVGASVSTCAPLEPIQ